MRHTRRLTEYGLLDREARVWLVERMWLTADEARALVDGGAEWAIGWCCGGHCGSIEWSDQAGADVLADTILPEVISREEGIRLRRKAQRKRAWPTVTVASLLRPASGDGALVFFSEAAPVDPWLTPPTG